MTLINSSRKNSPDQNQLRKTAEELVQKKEKTMPESLPPLISEDVESIVHELRVHQAELEMQNEELTRAQIELLALQERYFSLYELAPVGYVTLSSKGIVLECNLAAATMVGCNRRKLLGAPISRLILKDDQPIYYLKLKELLLSGEQQNFELRMVKNDGKAFWANLAIVGAVSDHAEVTTRVIISDISDRKTVEHQLAESEKRYKSLFNYAGVAIEYYQLDGAVISFNQIAAGLLGGAPEDYAGRSVYDIFPKHVAELYMSRMMEAVFSDLPKEYEDCINFMTNDSWYLSTYSKVFDDQGCVSGVQIISKDISDIKKREYELQAAKEAAEVANAAKGQFLSNMSHEIRTPINGIYGALQLLETTSLNEEQIEVTNIAHIATEGLLVLINDILDYSKIEAGHFQFERLPFQLEALIHETFALFSMTSDKKGIQMTVDLDEQVPKTLMGDPFRMRQILSNIIGNAIKFTDSGQIEVRVAPYGEQRTDASFLLFSIRDTGIGISSDIIGSIFDRFNQADNSNTRLYGGVGLGLAICKGLVEKMGGEIWVESQLGKGSTFYFTCPFDIPDYQDQQVPNSAMFHQKPIDISCEKAPQILLVEDCRESQHLIRLLSRKSGWDITVAENGHEAIQAIKAKDFDVILMDVQMPIMDGLEVSRRIRQMKQSKRIPIIAVTAHAMPGDRENCLFAGMDDYITKPVDFNELQRLIKRWT